MAHTPIDLCLIDLQFLFYPTVPDFYWFDGTTKIYENWALGEPNDEIGAEKCAEVMPSGKWNDMVCEWTLGYACKMRKCKIRSFFSCNHIAEY